MRFSITYDVSGVRELPLDYRGGFVALIRSALENDRINHTCQDIFESSPMCFAIRFDRKPTIQDRRIFIGNNLRLYFSSQSLTVGTVIYNGLLSITKFGIYSTEISNPLVSYIKEEDIKHSVVTFATLSPIIIRNYKSKDRYILPNEEGFSESLLNAISEQWQIYNNANSDSYPDIEFNILKFKKVVMTHYGGLVLGFTGVFQMSGDPNTLKFFYQCGIGYRRNSGFGFVEVDHT